MTLASTETLSKAQIALLSSCSEKTVDRTIKKLVSDGVLECQSSFGKSGAQQANRYHFLCSPCALLCTFHKDDCSEMNLCLACVLNSANRYLPCQEELSIVLENQMNSVQCDKNEIDASRASALASP